MGFRIVENEILFTRPGETVRLSACGKGCIRFQASPNCGIINQNWTLMPKKAEAEARIDGSRGILETGDTKAEIYDNGRVIFYCNGKKILEEKPELTFGCGIRNYRHMEGNLWKARVTFEPNENEHFYGLGHEPTNIFDLKGCSIDLRHLNTKCAIPYIYSSLGYGFLWNMPSTGVCELSANRTRWSSDCTRQIDYVVMGGSPREVSGRLADLTGHAPVMPHWATGLWQSRLRYENSGQLLETAEKYHSLGIPLSVIVIDYFHWTEQGDMKFEPKYWEDPKEMCGRIHDMDMKVMVSVWPTINEKSENYQTMLDNNMLVRTAGGTNRVFDFYGPQAIIDPTNPETRKFVWSKLKENYFDNGIDCFWLDEAEPEIHPEHFDNLIFSIGSGDETALLYPYHYSQTVYEGMKEAGRDDIITLARCAYLGSQKFGTLVWSGDIASTFQSLSEQVKTGLNMAMCGIVWWTTDIGGFFGGDPESDYFRELIVRWFQYGVFCPVTRLHGARIAKERTPDIIEPSGAGNELWSFGDEVFGILRELVELRERMRPYIEKHMRIASEAGVPVMRPMFFDYPDDEKCWPLGDQYMFGDDIIFAPILNYGQREREVYLPDGEWIRTTDKKRYSGGSTYTVKAEVNEYIAFVRAGANDTGIL